MDHFFFCCDHTLGFRSSRIPGFRDNQGEDLFCPRCFKMLANVRSDAPVIRILNVEGRVEEKLR